MRAFAATPGRLPVPEAEMHAGPAPDWPELDDAALADWEPGDPEPECPETAGREVLKAGRWDRAHGDGGGFAAGGVADGLPPGPVLAGLAADAWAAGLGRLSDDELIGVMRAARRLASWAAAMELAAMGDLWRRRMAEEQAGDTGAACHADDEIAAALTLTGRAADRVLNLAVALHRLPLTSQALAAGDIDLPRAAVIADEVTGLEDEHAAAVERTISGSAPGQTTGQLRAATRRAVMAADPSAARRRKERAQQDARVERWDEHAGTAALAGRDLPPASVLAADQHLTALARQLKAAGIPGTMDTLRAEAFLALLTGTPVGSPGPPGSPGSLSRLSSPGSLGSLSLLSSPGHLGSPVPGGPSAPHESASVGGSAAPTDRRAPAMAGFPGDTGPCWPPVDPSPSGLSGLSGTGNLPIGLRGTVNLTMPLATWLGQSDAPGHVGGHGPLDADDSRDLARALAARAGNPWCLTFTDTRGRPVAHGCARAGPASGRHHGERPVPRSRAGPPDEYAADARAGPVDESCTGDPRPRPGSTDDRWTFSIALLPGGSCGHAWQTAAYQPSPGLRHLVETRHCTCVFPGCRRPAAQCDKDHTVPYDQGGKTCLCNLAPLCRTHHRAKQVPGWHLTQGQPGVMTWRLPSGRTYQTVGDPYPV